MIWVFLTYIFRIQFRLAVSFIASTHRIDGLWVEPLERFGLCVNDHIGHSALSFHPLIDFLISKWHLHHWSFLRMLEWSKYLHQIIYASLCHVSSCHNVACNWICSCVYDFSLHNISVFLIYKQAQALSISLGLFPWNSLSTPWRLRAISSVKIELSEEAAILRFSVEIVFFGQKFSVLERWKLVQPLSSAA